MYVYRRKSSSNTNSNTLEPDWSQHYRPVACDTAQQYSSATLRFHSHKGKFRSHNFFTSFETASVGGMSKSLRKDNALLWG